MLGGKTSSLNVPSKNTKSSENKSSGYMNFGKSTIGSPPKSINLSGEGGKKSSPLDFSAKSNKPFIVPSNSLAPAFTESESSKSFLTSSTSKKGKSSASFGIIWIPNRRHNKKKDVVYNANHRYKDYRERSPSMYNLMSGDSQGSHSHHKEDTDLLVPERAKLPVGTTVGTVAATSDIPLTDSEIKPEEKEELLEHNKEETKEAGGDSSSNDEKKDPDYLENKDAIVDQYPESKWHDEKLGDNVDSVYLRPPPPHKVNSNTSNNEEEDCGIKCLYYTLQCCDCVLM